MLIMPDNTIFEPVKDPNMQEERTDAAHLPMEKRYCSFDEVEATYTSEQAQNEAARCLKCPTHWCQKECPAGVPVADFIRLLRAGDTEGAYRLIRIASNLPEICSRVCPQEKQCQSNCTRSIRTQAVGIGRLERYVTERHYASGAPEPAAPATGKKVAVVGSGPSGLSAAQSLISAGHQVTVFEKADRAGGLMIYGIPNMKLEKGVVERKVKSLESQGMQLYLNTAVGTDISPSELLAQYDAVILSVGTGNARMLHPEGVDPAHVTGICPAVTFLTTNTKSLLDSGMTDGKNISAKGKHVVIVGGGDTGNDCVGTSLRTGALSITQIEMLPQHVGRELIVSARTLRPKEKKVDTSQEEFKVKFGKDPHVYATTVKAAQADEEGRICAVTTVDLKAVYDSERRMKMEEIPGTEKELPCELLLIAAGFLGPDPHVAESFGTSTDERSNIKTTDYRTDIAKVFACGDCRTGQSLVVKAMTDGRECAKAVDAYLKEPRI